MKLSTAALILGVTLSLGAVALRAHDVDATKRAAQCQRIGDAYESVMMGREVAVHYLKGEYRVVRRPEVADGVAEPLTRAEALLDSAMMVACDP